MKHKIHACLASQLKTLNQNADAFEYQDQVDLFGRTCYIMACPINDRGTDFSFQTNKLSKTICRNLGRYSMFFPDGSIQAGEGSLL